MSDVLHNSALRTMRQCEQKYKYAYVEGLKEPAGPSLNVGTWFHLLMEAQGLKQGTVQGTLLHPLPERLYFGLPKDDNPHWVSTDAVCDDEGLISTSLVHEWVCKEVHSFWPAVDDDVADMPDNVWFLYERYMARWGAEMWGEDVLGVEVQWTRDDGPITYGGQADRIVRTGNGIVVTRDHKTTATKPSSDYRLKDSQLHLYAWGLEEWAKERDLTIDGIEYDYAVTYWPKMSLTKTGNLRKNQKVLDTHAAVVMLADMCDLSEGERLPEKFNEYLERCDAEGNRDFFQRHTVPLNERVIISLLDEGAVLKARMLRLEDDMPAVRSTGRNCDWCKFRDVCTGDLLGNDTTTLKDDMR